MRPGVLTIVAAPLACLTLNLPARSDDGPPEKAADRHWLWSTAYAVPAETTGEQSRSLSIVEGKDRHLYIGTANSSANSFLVDFDPASRKMKVVADAHQEMPLSPSGGPPINWAISPDRKTLYGIAIGGNQLHAYDLSAAGDHLPGRRLGPLSPGAKATDCRALSVGRDGTVWASAAVTSPGGARLLHVTRYRPGDPAPVDLGPVAIGNPEYTSFVDDQGKEKPFHHGVLRLKDGTLVPRDGTTGICAASDGTVYLTTLHPYTVHALRMPRVAGVTTAYFRNSHADMIIGRLLQTDTLDDNGRRPSIELASLYTDQVPGNDISRSLTQRRGVPVRDKVEDALTLGTDRLAVDGVLLVAEHGDYPRSETGQTIYPKRRMFGQVLDVFDRSGRVVPVFIDKHLADNWSDAKWIHDEARRRRIPLMAGSSLPVLWRHPPADVRRGARLAQVVVISYHTLDGYGFHAVEVLQCLAERREGGETGVRSVHCITGPSVWRAGAEGVYDRALLDAALSRLEERPLPAGKRIEDLVPEPILFVVDYNDGLRGCVFTLNGAVGEWAAAWRYQGEKPIESTLFWTQESRPFGHFNLLLMGIERMMHTGRPTWPVERTLLTSGILDAALRSKRDGGRRLETPWLDVSYKSEWDWTEPPAPPPGRGL